MAFPPLEKEDEDPGTREHVVSRLHVSPRVSVFIALTRAATSLLLPTQSAALFLSSLFVGLLGWGRKGRQRETDKEEIATLEIAAREAEVAEKVDMSGDVFFRSSHVRRRRGEGVRAEDGSASAAKVRRPTNEAPFYGLQAFIPTMSRRRGKAQRNTLPFDTQECRRGLTHLAMKRIGRANVSQFGCSIFPLRLVKSRRD